MRAAPRRAARARARPRPAAAAAATGAAALLLAGLAAGLAWPRAAPPAAPGPITPTAASTPTAPQTHPWGPTAEDVAAATAEAGSMTPQEVAGQVIVGRLYSPDPAEAAALVRDLHLAGVMLTGQAVAGLDQVRALAAAVQAEVAASGRDWPAIVSTDNEGGTVQRLSGATGPWTTFPAFAVAGQVEDPAVVADAYAAMGRELRASGVTVDWAPVADVTVPGQDVTIGSRAAGEDPAAVGRTAVAAAEGLLAGGVLPAVKHFPGHGSLTENSHVALPAYAGTPADLRERDLPPFATAVQAGVPMVMTAHVVVPAWNPDLPASLAPEAYRVLREDLGFAGVAVTDSLGMGAVTGVGDSGAVAVAALAAGADLLLNPADNESAHAAVVAALADGTLPRARVDEAAGRVLALMRHQDHLAATAGPVGTEDVGTAGPAVEALLAAAGM